MTGTGRVPSEASDGKFDWVLARSSHKKVSPSTDSSQQEWPIWCLYHLYVYVCVYVCGWVFEFVINGICRVKGFGRKLYAAYTQTHTSKPHSHDQPPFKLTLLELFPTPQPFRRLPLPFFLCVFELVQSGAYLPAAKKVVSNMLQCIRQGKPSIKWVKGMRFRSSRGGVCVCV